MLQIDIQRFGDFNPRPSHEGRQIADAQKEIKVLFQSTSLTRGTTRRSGASRKSTANFNPRPSHEGRPRTCSVSYRPGNFNPRPSHEGRQTLYKDQEGAQKFQSTSLTRGTTDCPCHFRAVRLISIHVPHTRDDEDFRTIPIYQSDFNPRPSHEGRPLSS